MHSLRVPPCTSKTLSKAPALLHSAVHPISSGFLTLPQITGQLMEDTQNALLSHKSQPPALTVGM